jgi:uncharacterized protein (DUF1499 family)
VSAGRALRAIGISLAFPLVLALAAVVIGPFTGLFAGTRPENLGFADGRFRADGDSRPNWVSSTAPPADAKHAIAPLAFTGEPATAWTRLEAVIAAMPRAKIVTRAPAYLHVEFSSKGMGFVDDAEFALDAAARLIHARSGARLGIRDFGVNRERVENLRRIMSEAPAAR